MDEPLVARWLGRVRYSDGLALQERQVAARRRGDAPDTLFLLEHEPVITLGCRSDRGHLLASEETLRANGTDVHEVGRGGGVTWHGPGQLVGYPIVALDPDRRDLHWYLRDLEEALVRTVSDLGIRG